MTFDPWKRGTALFAHRRLPVRFRCVLTNTRSSALAIECAFQFVVYKKKSLPGKGLPSAGDVFLGFFIDMSQALSTSRLPGCREASSAFFIEERARSARGGVTPRPMVAVCFGLT